MDLRKITSSSESGFRTPEHFATTHWTNVLTAREGESVAMGEALEKLCRTYWYPLYSYIRRRGYDLVEAQDLTQGFFARLLEKNYLGDVDRSKGKFRSFLLASVNHFLANEWDRAHTLKRGGKVKFVPIDADSGEEMFSREPACDWTPEKIFEQRWAEALLAQVFEKLRAEFAESEKVEIFESCKVFLTGDRSSVSYAELADQLGMSQGALKMTVLRMRRRYRELLRLEIAHTVASPDEIDDEIRSLLAAMS